MSGVGTPAAAPSATTDPELRVDFGGPFAHREVAPDTAVRLGRAAVVRNQRVERALGRAVRCGGEVRGGIETVECLGLDAAGRRDGQHFAAQRNVQAAVPGHRERVGNRLVGQRRREEHRAVCFLAPQVAPDVAGGDRAGIEALPRIADGMHARRDAAVDLADYHGAAAGVVNHPGLQVIGAEVDERTDRSLGANNVRDRELVEPVLRRDDAAGVR